MKFDDLVDLDEMQTLKYSDRFVGYIHRDHRFCLPMLFRHQNAGDLPRPCTLVLFDRHHDLAKRKDTEIQSKIRGMKKNGFSESELLMLCRDDLRLDDSDWIWTGMELGMIDDVVSFGVEENDEWRSVVRP